MNLDQLIEEIKFKAKPFYMSEEGVAYDDIHDWNHMRRVYGAAKKMLEIEPKANRGEVLLAAILHDIGRANDRQASHAEISYNLAKEFLPEYQTEFLANNIDLEKVLKMVRYHSIAHICPDKAIAESLEFNILTDADKVDMFGALGMVRVPIAEAYKQPQVVYHTYEHLAKMTDPNNFQFRSEAGRKIGQKYKDYSEKFVKDLEAQQQEFELD